MCHLIIRVLINFFQTFISQIWYFCGFRRYFYAVFRFSSKFLTVFRFLPKFRAVFRFLGPPWHPPLNEFPFTRAILWTRSVYSRIEHEIEIVLDYKIVHPSFIYILWQKTNTQSAKYWFPVWKTGTKKYTYILLRHMNLSRSTADELRSPYTSTINSFYSLWHKQTSQRLSIYT